MGNYWCLMRQDDNGNVFVMVHNLTREEANKLLLEYQQKGHKQSYWVEEQSKA